MRQVFTIAAGIVVGCLLLIVVLFSLAAGCSWFIQGDNAGNAGRATGWVVGQVTFAAFILLLLAAVVLLVKSAVQWWRWRSRHGGPDV